MDNLILQPLVQYGFLGFSAVLLCVVIWLIRRLLGLLEATNQIIASNTEAIRDLRNMTGDLLKLDRSLYEKVISRPCIAGREE